MTTDWRAYEDVARRVLADMRDVLGISSVEGKQVLAGRSSANWEVDAKAWSADGENFLLVEVRRRRSRLKQEHLAAIAYRIVDTGAAGGIVVTPLPLQSGALRVATHTDIALVRLTPESTNERYLAEFMGRRFIGLSAHETFGLTDSAESTPGQSSGA
jgi:hypothetical protein